LIEEWNLAPFYSCKNFNLFTKDTKCTAFYFYRKGERGTGRGREERCISGKEELLL
jgi:hypothetical protein